jgi:hypothetical protein
MNHSRQEREDLPGPVTTEMPGSRFSFTSEERFFATCLSVTAGSV